MLKDVSYSHFLRKVGLLPYSDDMTALPCPRCPSSGKKIAKEQNRLLFRCKNLWKKGGGMRKEPFWKGFSPFLHLYFLNVT